MSRHLLKTLKTMSCSIVVFALVCMGSLMMINAEEIEEKEKINHNSGITELVEKLYSGDDSVSVEKNGVDITEQFVQKTKGVYLNGDTAFLGYILAKDGLDLVEEHEIVPYAITSRSVTKVLSNQVITGTSALTQKPISDMCYIYITFTIVWDQTTEKISGSPRKPTIVADPNEDNYDTLIVTDVQYNATIINGGFSVFYSNISASLKGTNSLDDWSVDQYYSYKCPSTYTFTPANGIN